MDKNQSPQDILNEIFQRAEKPEPAPPPAPPPEQPPEDATPPPPERHRRPSLSVYLAVLFGAAFLVLLAVYFTQRRGNDDAPSREQLLENVQRLEEENKALQRDKESLDQQLEREKRNHLSAEWEQARTLDSMNELTMCAMTDNILNWLERFNNAGDWLMSATLVANCDYLFNEHNPEFAGDPPLPSQAARYLELRETVLHKGACMYLTRTATTEGLENHSSEEDWGGHYKEQPHIGNNKFEEQDLEAARALMPIFVNYPIIPSTAAWHMVEAFQPDSGHIERLSGGAFQPSTAALFEQIKADLLAADYLTEDENGALRQVFVYGTTPGNEILLPVG